ncbi:hypothetical protein HRR79_002477 [Exophiala dermatitidis]|nr:hypothetical protein HRR79_002477 [Exophiala dermatitidis]
MELDFVWEDHANKTHHLYYLRHKSQKNLKLPATNRPSATTALPTYTTKTNHYRISSITRYSLIEQNSPSPIHRSASLHANKMRVAVKKLEFNLGQGLRQLMRRWLIVRPYTDNAIMVRLTEPERAR